MKQYKRKYDEGILDDAVEIKTYEVYLNGWNVGKFYLLRDAQQLVKFLQSKHMPDTEGRFSKELKIKNSSTYLTDNEIQLLKSVGVKVEFTR